MRRLAREAPRADATRRTGGNSATGCEEKTSNRGRAVAEVLLGARQRRRAGRARRFLAVDRERAFARAASARARESRGLVRGARARNLEPYVGKIPAEMMCR